MLTKNILLIHGYGVRATYPIIRPKEDKYLGFGGFSNLLEAGNTHLFVWGCAVKYSFLDMLNPFKYLQLYNQEKKLACSKDILQQLHNQIQSQNIQTIVCHSMGGYLVQQYLDSFDLPNSVKKIIIVQADISRMSRFNTPNNVSVINLYCPWDQALWESVVVNRYIPAGLFGLTSSTISNTFFPLYKDINLHESSIKDKNILMFV